MNKTKDQKKCPLCNGKTFNQGDDFNELCIEHATKVISLLFCRYISEIALPIKEGGEKDDNQV